MKNIILLAIMLPFAVEASYYVGAKAGGTVLKTGASITNPSNYDMSHSYTFYLNSVSADKQGKSFLCSVFGGYAYNSYGVFTPFSEIDYEYSGANIKSNQIAFIPRATGTVKFLMNNEHVDVKAAHAFGFSFGSKIMVNEKISALLSVRFNVNSYKVNAYHLNDIGENVSNNSAEKNAWLLGVEPTIGTEYKKSEKISFRLTASYNIQQSKQIIDNYINNTTYANEDIKAGLKIDPSAFNVRFAAIYSF